MLIELNGMCFHLRIFTAPGGVLRAEIVDEAFDMDISGAPVKDIDQVAGLVRRYTGMRPDGHVLNEMKAEFQRQEATQSVSPKQSARPNQQADPSAKFVAPAPIPNVVLENLGRTM